ncbi:DoxX [Rubripirellula lacrimiformis]|uniref:DoxX n=1 Tax=Rubripirellula lacrimiformis TaxID=1930273 RepID=A0A517N965_9BACT|nr:DoxX family protein [Rubripirellula lacrimiformis]QDT03674.1 DoxX [Rubripirellula lacrimiformis]
MIVLEIIISGAFLYAGVSKLWGAPSLADQFDDFRLPRFMMYVIGSLEIIGSIGLFVEPLTLWAAVGLAALMALAVASHIKARHTFDKIAPSLSLMILATMLAAIIYR